MWHQVGLLTTHFLSTSSMVVDLLQLLLLHLRMLARLSWSKCYQCTHRLANLSKQLDICIVVHMCGPMSQVQMWVFLLHIGGRKKPVPKVTITELNRRVTGEAKDFDEVMAQARRVAQGGDM